jgi:hypothetical protein
MPLHNAYSERYLAGKMPLQHAIQHRALQDAWFLSQRRYCSTQSNFAHCKTLSYSLGAVIAACNLIPRIAKNASLRHLPGR